MKIKILGVLLIATALIAVGLYFVTKNFRAPQPEVIPVGDTPIPGSSLAPAFPASQKAVSSMGDVSFEYPGSWILQDTTPTQGRGQFGPISQAWILTSFQPQEPGRGGIPENSVKIDIELMADTQGTSIDDVIACQDETVDCRIEILANQPFRKTTTTLDDGMIVQSYGRISTNKVLRIVVMIQAGEQQKENGQIVETILSTLTYVE